MTEDISSVFQEVPKDPADMTPLDHARAAEPHFYRPASPEQMQALNRLVGLPEEAPFHPTKCGRYCDPASFASTLQYMAAALKSSGYKNDAGSVTSGIAAGSLDNIGSAAGLVRATGAAVGSSSLQNAGFELYSQTEAAKNLFDVNEGGPLHTLARMAPSVAGILGATAAGGPLAGGAVIGGLQAGSTYNRTESLGATTAAGGFGLLSALPIFGQISRLPVMQSLAQKVGEDTALATVFQSGARAAIQKYGLAKATPVLAAKETLDSLASGTSNAGLGAGQEVIAQLGGAEPDISLDRAGRDLAIGALLHVAFRGVNSVQSLRSELRQAASDSFDTPSPTIENADAGEPAGSTGPASTNDSGATPEVQGQPPSANSEQSGIVAERRLYRLSPGQPEATAGATEGAAKPEAPADAGGNNFYLEGASVARAAETPPSTNLEVLDHPVRLLDLASERAQSLLKAAQTEDPQATDHGPAFFEKAKAVADGVVDKTTGRVTLFNKPPAESVVDSHTVTDPTIGSRLNDSLTAENLGLAARDRFFQRVKDQFGEETATAARGLADATAGTWAKVNGKASGEFYNVFQDVRGVDEALKNPVKFLGSQAKAILSLAKNGDRTQIVQGLASIYEKTILPLRPDLQTMLHAEYKVKNGKWSDTQSERFARDMGKYLADGTAPVPGLEPVFAKWQSWLKDTYAGVTEVGTKPEAVGPAAKQVFDFAMGRDVPQGGIEDPIVLADKIKATVQDAINTGVPFDQALADAAYQHINWGRVGGGDAKKAVLQSLELSSEQRMQSEEGQVRTHQQVQESAQNLLGDTVSLIDWAKLNADELSKLDEKLTALRVYRDAATINLMRKAQAYRDQGPESPGTALETAQAWKTAADAEYYSGKIARGIARGLSSMQIVSEASAKAMKALDAVNQQGKELSNAVNAASDAGLDVPNKGIVDVLRDPTLGPKLASMIAEAGPPVDGGPVDPNMVPRIMRFVQDNVNSRGMINLLLEFRKAALLSGAKTFTATLLGQTVNGLMKPLNWSLGGLLRGDLSSAYDGLSMYYHLTASAFDFLKMVKGDVDRPSSLGSAFKAFLEERPILESSNDPNEQPQPIIPWWAGGRVLRLGLSAHQGTFEYYKQMAYRAKVRVDTLRVLKNLNPEFLSNLSSADRKALLAAALERSLNPDGSAARDPEGDLIYPRAVRYAEEATNTQELNQGTLGKSIMELTNRHPVLQLFVPFRKVPTNLVRETWRYTPGLNLLQTEFRQQLTSPDPAVRSEAAGKIATGVALSTAALGYILSGKITGGGPADKARRDALMATGWQPYSVLLDDGEGNKKYVSYHRIEPFGPLFGILADFSEAGGYMKEGDAQQAASAIILGLSRNITEKSYFRGVTDGLELLSKDDRTVEAALRAFVASNVPNAIGSTSAAFDDSMRDPRTILEAIKARLPMWNDTVSPKRDLFGHPVPPTPGYVPFFDSTDRSTAANLARTLSPLATNTVTDDLVKNEIANLNYSWSRPPQSLGGLDLTTFTNAKDQTAYDRYLELVGTVKYNGQTIDRAMSDLMRSPEYRRLPMPDGVNDQMNPRIMLVNRYIGAYRELAKAQMLQEFPRIKTLLEQVQKEERTGRQSSSELLQHLNQAR